MLSGGGVACQEGGEEGVAAQEGGVGRRQRCPVPSGLGEKIWRALLAPCCSRRASANDDDEVRLEHVEVAAADAEGQQQQLAKRALVSGVEVSG